MRIRFKEKYGPHHYRAIRVVHNKSIVIDVDGFGPPDNLSWAVTIYVNTTQLSISGFKTALAAKRQASKMVRRGWTSVQFW